MCGHTPEVVIYSKFHRNQFRGLGAPVGQSLPIPITLAIAFYNSLHYRASRDQYRNLKVVTHWKVFFRKSLSKATFERKLSSVSPA